MNYKLSFALGDLFLGRGDAKAADDELKVLRQNYPKEALYDLMNIVDSHDTVRAIYKFGGGKDTVAQATRKDFDYALGKARMKLAATFLMGYPGMPTVYYGDEAGQYGSSDPDCRRTYPWGHEDQDLIAHYQKVISVRNSHKALFAHGDVNTLKAEGDIYAFARTAVDGSGQAAVVALNRGAAKAVELPAGQFADGTVFTDQISGAQATVSGGKLTLTLGENQSMMLLNA
jgi:glycosidase